MIDAEQDPGAGLSRTGPASVVLQLAIAGVVLVGFYLTSRYSYPLFHSLAELFAVVVAVAVFVIAWHTRGLTQNHSLVLLGIGYLFVAAVDLLHTLTFKGMGVVPLPDSNVTTQLWVVARAVEALSLLVAVALARRRPEPAWILLAFLAMVSGLCVAVFAGAFPDCYRPGGGLTTFKIGAEVFICVLLAVAAYGLLRQRDIYPTRVRRLLLGSILLTVAAEVAFMLYTDVFGFANLLGHCLKLVSFYLIFRALVSTGLVEPVGMLFRNLKRSELALSEENARLEASRKELEAKNAELTKLNDEKNELLGMAAHDIRQPLSVIRTYAQILQDGLDDDSGLRARTYSAAILHSADFSLDLLSRVLDLSAVESGRLELHPEPVDLRELVARCVTRESLLARVRGMKLSFECRERQLWAEVDALRFEEVVSNLIGNARKYSPDGTSIQVSLTTSGEEVVLSVSDQGPGIPKEELDRLFRPFSKTSVRPVSGEKSTGLGLAIAQKVVTAHRGRIAVESELGKGSTFVVILPVGAGRSNGKSPSAATATPPARTPTAR